MAESGAVFALDERQLGVEGSNHDRLTHALATDFLQLLGQALFGQLGADSGVAAQLVLVVPARAGDATVFVRNTTVAAVPEGLSEAELLAAINESLAGGGYAYRFVRAGDVLH